jgi:integron integrase
MDSPLLEQVRQRALEAGLSERTASTYAQVVRRFVLFHRKQHPTTLGAADVLAFLTSLAVQGHVAASTYNIARSALLFLYTTVLLQPLDPALPLPRAKQQLPLPQVLSREAVQLVLAQLEGVPWLVAALLYGSGLRLGEAVRLRVGDVKLDATSIDVRDQAGATARTTVLPQRMWPQLEAQLARVQRLHARDVAAGWGAVPWPLSSPARADQLSSALAHQYVFPAAQRTPDRHTGVIRRHHISPDVIQRAVRAAVRTAGVGVPANCQTLRHSFALHLLEAGYDVRQVQTLLGHASVSSTLVYARLMSRTDAPRSPLDDKA